MRLAGFRIRMAAGEPGDGLAEMRFRGVQAAAVSARGGPCRYCSGRRPDRGAAPRSNTAPGPRGMAVLFEVLAGEIQLIGGGDLLRCRRLGGHLAVAGDPAFIDRAIGQQAFAIVIENRGEQFRRDFLR